MTALPPISDQLLMFVQNNIKENPSPLRLKYHGKINDFDLNFALTQIESRQKTKKKLASFIKDQRFIFPSTLSAEQASHEAVAAYHATLIEKNSELLDMTAGLGIDVMTMAQRCGHATACELDDIKAQALRHNCEVLGLDNIAIVAGESIEWISKIDKHFDTIFIDPARRGEDNARTYNFHDCQPDIMKLQDILSSKTSRLLIKASPLLDVAQTLKDINNVRAIRAICVNGECKEILVETLYIPSLLPLPASVLKEAIDLKDDGTLISKFSFYDTSETEADSSTSDPVNCIPYALETDVMPGHYLYEPNAAVMKLAPWNELCRTFDGLKKLASSSHLFISEKKHENFPGRILKIEKRIEKKDRKTLKNLPVNVTVRNYPLSASELRKQLKVREGSDLFIYGTRISAPLLILAKRHS